MDVDLLLVVVGVVASLVVVPAGLGALFLGPGAPAPDSTAFLVVGVIAMAPGFLMGGAALWVAARG